MRRVALLLAILFLARNAFAQTPAIDHISPTYAIVSSPDLTLTVTGSGFAGGNTVMWNSVPLTTTFLASTQLTAVIPAANMAAIGMAQVTVSGTGSSNGVSFRIISPIAQVTSWTPTVFTPFAATQLTVYGSGFTPAAVVYFDWQAFATTYVSPTQVNASISSGFITVGEHSVHVINGAAPSPTEVLSLSTQPTAFGSQTVGTTTTLTVTVTNVGSSTITLSGFSIGGVNLADFANPSSTCGATLAASTSCTASVTFHPSLLISESAFLTLTSSAVGSPQSVTLTGTGTPTTIGSVSIDAATQPFGTIVQSTPSSPISSVVTNTGTPTYTITSIVKAGSNSADFDITGSSCATSTPYTTGQSCSITSVFTPATTGAEGATVTLTDNSASSPNVITLSGSGIASGGHYMSLSWTASGSLSITGYNVYRASVSGGPYTLLTGTPVSATSYTDNTVTSGSTYYYVITGIGTNPPYSTIESAYSSEVSGTIP